MEENNVKPTLDETKENQTPIVEETLVVNETSVEDVKSESSKEDTDATIAIPDTKEGIIERIKQLAESDNDISRQEIDTLKSHFYRIIKSEGEAALKEFIENGGAAEDFTPIIDPTEQLFKDQMNIIREKRAAKHEAQEKLKEENYLKKIQIIEKIKNILETPDEVNKSYNDFRQLQQEWNDIKEVPADKATELWKTYQVNVERFYDTLKLNNEFRAYDFKKNLEMKTVLCEKAEELTKETDVISAFRKLQQLHQQFREIGPVAKELREEIWNRFRIL